MRTLVRPVALLTSAAIGSGRAFILAVVVVVSAVGVGAWFGYNDHFLAILSSSLSVVTFLLVFLLQYRESRDTAAIQLKLNELLRAVDGAREHVFADLEHLAEEEQESMSREHRQNRLGLSASSQAESLTPPAPVA